MNGNSQSVSYKLLRSFLRTVFLNLFDEAQHGAEVEWTPKFV